MIYLSETKIRYQSAAAIDDEERIPFTRIIYIIILCSSRMLIPIGLAP